jgi:hypothetical protein
MLKSKICKEEKDRQRALLASLGCDVMTHGQSQTPYEHPWPGTWLDGGGELAGADTRQQVHACGLPAFVIHLPAAAANFLRPAFRASFPGYVRLIWFSLFFHGPDVSIGFGV